MQSKGTSRNLEELDMNSPNPEDLRVAKSERLNRSAPHFTPVPRLEELDVDPLHRTGSVRDESDRSGLTLFAAGTLAALCLFGCTQEKISVVAQPPVVRVATVQASDSARDLVLTGQLDADISVAASFGAAGSVEKVLVDEGQTVSKGQVLAVLDAGSLKDQLALAQAKADQAEDAWKRMEPMHRDGTLPEIKWVEVETGRDQARSAVSMARRDLEDAVLRAPMTGIVARRSIQPGERTVPGVSAFTLVQTGTMLAVLPVAEKDIARIRPGMPARVDIRATGSQVVGKVREIGVEADPLTRTYRVKVALPNPGGVLKVGMVSQVRLRVPGAAPVPVAPPAAVLVDGQDRRYVWVVTDSVIHRRDVRTGELVQEGIGIDSGLSAGEAVVVSGTPMLSEGLRVQAGK
jgi:RND family efflux transporter MFP subunit